MHINRIQHILNDSANNRDKHDKFISVLARWKDFPPEHKEAFASLYSIAIENCSFATRTVDPENLIIALNREIGIVKSYLTNVDPNDTELEDYFLGTLIELQSLREEMRAKLLKGEKVELI